mmetsp:Transcript_19109/g.62996  ORF Transcript_19109/g.62996 Transcript_19109/m.62996 type:complete len:570 (-) Transcript_19109:48-1757(-)
MKLYGCSLQALLCLAILQLSYPWDIQVANSIEPSDKRILSCLATRLRGGRNSSLPTLIDIKFAPFSTHLNRPPPRSSPPPPPPPALHPAPPSLPPPPPPPNTNSLGFLHVGELIPLISFKSGSMMHTQAVLSFAQQGLIWQVFLPPSSSGAAEGSRATRHCILHSSYDSITSFDLQFERMLSQRERFPLVRMSVELKVPPRMMACEAAGGRRVSQPGRLIVTWMKLEDASILEQKLCRIQEEQEKQLGRSVTMVLPAWVQLLHNFLPTCLYSPSLRKGLETVVVAWMSISGLWACWQLYQHVELFGAALRPFVKVLRMRFEWIMQKINKTFQTWTDKYIHWLKPLDVIRDRLFSSGAMSSLLAHEISRIYGVVASTAEPLLSSVQAGMQMLLASVAASTASLSAAISPYTSSMYLPGIGAVQKNLASKTSLRAANSISSYYRSYSKSFQEGAKTLLHLLSSRKASLGQESLARVGTLYFRMLVQTCRNLWRRLPWSSNEQLLAPKPPAATAPLLAVNGSIVDGDLMELCSDRSSMSPRRSCKRSISSPDMSPRRSRSISHGELQVEERL